jgi:hypothetical protein
MSTSVAAVKSRGNWEREAVARLPAILGEWLGEPVVEVVLSAQHDGVEIDAVARTPTRTFVIEVKGSDDIAALERGLAHLLRIPRGHGAIPLLVVPYMGPRARTWAREKQVSWADLSGNADIRAPNLRVFVAGNVNQYAHSGRPANPFAPKYARVSRVLLAEADRWWRQRDLCSETALSDATVSRAVGHLKQAHLLETDSDGAVRARAPSLLLDAWAQRYSFADHRVHRFQTVARTGHAALQSLAKKLSSTGTTWAATGLSAAYMWTQFADFRLTTVFVDQLPRDTEALGLHPVERGENVWLVVPRDEGVFYKKVEQGVWCAHPVQVYLDLLGHPERAAEAATRLRADLLQWRA